MTSLRDEVAALSRPARQECSVATFLAGREDRSEWEELFTDPELTVMGIHRAMRLRGFERTYEPVQRHRRKECSCARAA